MIFKFLVSIEVVGRGEGYFREEVLIWEFVGILCVFLFMLFDFLVFFVDIFYDGGGVLRTV